MELRKTIGIAVGACAALLWQAAPAAAADGDLRSIAGMQHHDRVLLVFAPGLADPRLTAQRRVFARMGPEAANRDLLLVQVAKARVIGAHDTADKLRHRFGVAGDGFRALLIGKDGHVALERPGPIAAGEITARIDAMPMRQAEARAGTAAH